MAQDTARHFICNIFFNWAGIYDIFFYYFLRIIFNKVVHNWKFSICLVPLKNIFRNYSTIYYYDIWTTPHIAGQILNMISCAVACCLTRLGHKIKYIDYLCFSTYHSALYPGNKQYWNNTCVEVTWPNNNKVRFFNSRDCFLIWLYTFVMRSGPAVFRGWLEQGRVVNLRAR